MNKKKKAPVSIATKASKVKLKDLEASIKVSMDEAFAAFAKKMEKLNYIPKLDYIIADPVWEDFKIIDKILEETNKQEEDSEPEQLSFPIMEEWK
jgi:hypothetical protein